MATDFSTAAYFAAKFRALIADDQRSSREAITRLLQEDDSIEIVEKCVNGREALEAIDRYSPDMVFLDVHLPELAGFQVMESRAGKVPAVIFLSALDRYAAQAFEADAADYILKPFQDERLLQAVARAKLRVQMQRGKMFTTQEPIPVAGPVPETPGPENQYAERLAVRSAGRILFQKVQQVDCFTASANYVQVHTGTQVHRIRCTMNHLEARLDPRRFARIHRCTVINLDRLKDIRPLPHGDYIVTLLDGKEFTLSRNYRPKFRRLLSSLS
jgi:two-component system, LytTR family, response regulator